MDEGLDTTGELVQDLLKDSIETVDKETTELKYMNNNFTNSPAPNNCVPSTTGGTLTISGGQNITTTPYITFPTTWGTFSATISKVKLRPRTINVTKSYRKKVNVRFSLVDPGVIQLRAHELFEWMACCVCQKTRDKIPFYKPIFFLEQATINEKEEPKYFPSRLNLAGSPYFYETCSEACTNMLILSQME